MFERIVVGFDESDGSRDALALGKALAGRLGARLVVVGVVPSPTGGSLMPALPANAFTNLTEQARIGVETAAAEYDAEAEIVEASSAARGLEELTETIEGDLLVIGCAGAGEGTARAGHKARALMQGSRCAVAIAPAGYRNGEERLSLIGAAVDGSPESGHALEAAAEIAGDGTVRVLSVATDFAEAWGFWGATYALSELDEASKDATRTILRQATASLPDETTTETVMLEGIASEQLRKQSEELDLLCLGSRGYGPILRVLLGSVSSELLKEVACPVVVVPRGAAE
jgi:nucleotide-binding universal stress UspA family protein